MDQGVICEELLTLRKNLESVTVTPPPKISGKSLLEKVTPPRMKIKLTATTPAPFQTNSLRSTN